MLIHFQKGFTAAVLSDNRLCVLSKATIGTHTGPHSFYSKTFCLLEA